MLIRNWTDFSLLLTEKAVRLVALDVRGTLVTTPRRGNLRKVLKAWGANGSWVDAADEVVPARVLEQYGTETNVADWTLITLIELWLYAREHGLHTRPVEIEPALRGVVEEYWCSATPLIPDHDLHSFITHCHDVDVRVVVTPDGLLGRETELFRRHFPASLSIVDGFYTSEVLNINKLSADYFARIAQREGIRPNQMLVIGDRVDKDVEVPAAAGCLSLLVSGIDVQGVLRTESVTQLIPPDVHPVVAHGLVLGRFQPFHLEHFRFVTAALRRSSHLWIGITNPYPLARLEDGTNEERLAPEANPLPYWLRQQCIEVALTAANHPRTRFSIIPVPLTLEGLHHSVPPSTTVFTTAVEEWSNDKERLLGDAGLEVQRLHLGPKSITATAIREYIRRDDERWRSLVPHAVVQSVGDALVRYIKRSTASTRRDSTR